METLFNIISRIQDFADPKNLQFVESLWHISRTTKNASERDISIDLLLYCEANENGPLGMKPADQIRGMYSSHKV